jgi:transposase
VIPVLSRHFALERAMMGRQTDDQGHLFYDFRFELVPYYPTLGRPSIDPVLMLRMLIIGYVFGLRSERLLCREVQVNFAYSGSVSLA